MPSWRHAASHARAETPVHVITNPDGRDILHCNQRTDPVRMLVIRMLRGGAGPASTIG